MKIINSVLATIAKGFIRFYAYFISPMLAPSCRYQPTCSSYAMEAIEVHGGVKGVYLALRRIGRCHPWGGSGFDPVPGVKKPTIDDHNCCAGHKAN